MSGPVWLVGVGLAVVSAILSNLGLNLQKRNHLNNHSKIEAEIAEAEQANTSANASTTRSHKHKRRRKHSHRKKHRVQPNDILIRKDDDEGGSDNDHTIDISRRTSSAEAPSNFDEISSHVLDDSTSFTAHYSSENEDIMSSSQSFMNQAPRSDAVIDVNAQPKSPTNRDEAHSKINYTKQLLWQGGLALVIIGSIFDFAALAFAPQSVIAPLGSLTLVSNVFLAPILLKEKLSRRDVICTLVIVVGAATAVLCASHEDATPTVDQMFHYFLDFRFIIYGIVVVACVIGLRLLVWKASKLRKLAHSDRAAAKKYEKVWTKHHRFGYSAAAGIMGAQSVLFAKCTSTLFRTMVLTGDIMFVHPGTYGVLVGLGITIFFQIRWLNSGLRLFPALYVVPVFQSFWILVSVISGMIFFQEYEGVLDDPLKAFGFCAGLALTISGVYFLSQKSAAATAEETAAEGEYAVANAEPRRHSLSVSASFEPGYMSNDNESATVVEGDKPHSYFDLIRARKREKEMGTAKQRLLPEEKKEKPVTLPYSVSPMRQSSKHSTVLNGSRHLSPLIEGNSPSSASQSQPLSPPRLRARSDGDQKEPTSSMSSHLESQTMSEHEAALLDSTPQAFPSRGPPVGSHSFSFANQFLHPSTAQTSSPGRTRYRSASFDHVGEFEHTRYKKRTNKALDFGAALSALTSPRNDDDGFGHTPSPRRPKQSWQDVQRVAAFNAPGVSAFAQVLGRHNYEREPGSSSTSGDGDSEDYSDSDSSDEKDSRS